MTFTVGQPVIMTRPYGGSGHDTGEVIQVGRTYVYATEPLYSQRGGRKFHQETRQEVLRGGYTGGEIYTLDEWDELHDRNNAVARLKAFGVTVTSTRITLSQLQKMLAIIDQKDPS